MFNHTFTAAKRASIAYRRSSAMIDTQMGLLGGEFEFNGGKPTSFKIPGNIWFKFDVGANFGGILTIEQTGAGLGVNLRMAAPESDALYLMPLLQNFDFATDGSPFMIFKSVVEFANQETRYRGIDEIELSWTKKYI